MTEQEARKIIAILLTADGGCSLCAKDLCQQFREAFPEYGELARTLVDAEFKKERR